MTTIEMRVYMCCAGCENKIKKALHKVKGVEEVDIDMSLQKVTASGWADQKKVLKSVRKTGRRAELWQFPYNPEMRNHNFTGHHDHNGSNYGDPSSFYASQTSGSSYNYYKHGYNNHDHTRMHRPNSKKQPPGSCYPPFVLRKKKFPNKTREQNACILIHA
ncbi:heavy metal-associated isoprenylated plant protein 28-like [Salvia hispanica]|uniref:heavy metal-associated isoprenylated plant protein 28-like n=1 Tax=Salvia hispanica TaxID=49212 RepID=UPI002009D3ED|nr:heavy metal-associated isoprenylated plant protein 28-like [Salvia hispanica]